MKDSNQKILVIGSSFAAAIREAVPRGDENVFFVAGSGDAFLDDIALHGDQDSLTLSGSSSQSALQLNLWRLTSGSDEPVLLSDFDAFVVIGMFGPPNPWSQINLQATTEALPEVIAKHTPISFGLYSHISRYRAHRDKAKKLVDMIRRHDAERRVLMVPSPHIMEGAEEFDERYCIPEWWACLNATEKAILQKNENAIYERFIGLSGGTIVVPPEETVADGNRCPKKFSEGALGSANFEANMNPAWGSPSKSIGMYITHKNKRYGEIIWNAVLDQVRT